MLLPALWQMESFVFFEAIVVAIPYSFADARNRKLIVLSAPFTFAHLDAFFFLVLEGEVCVLISYFNN